MTGYAHVDIEINGQNYRMHLKSVNNKIFDFKFRAPKSWLPIEIWARKATKDFFTRGSFEFWTDESPSETNEDGGNVQNFFEKLDLAMKSVKGVSSFRIPPALRAKLLGQNLDIWFHRKSKRFASDVFHQSFRELLNKLGEERSQEGKAMTNVIHDYARALEDLLNKAHSFVSANTQKIEDDYKQKLENLINEKIVPENYATRLQTEVIFLLEKKDVSEELKRIEYHVSNLKNLFKEDEVSMGRKLDFVAQELNREWTTLGNKLQKTEIYPIIRDAKLTIEKIREQSLNLA